MLAATYDARRGRTIVLQQTPAGATRTWEWDTRGWDFVPTAATPPPPSESALVYDETCGVAISFGGGLGSGVHNETWSFDGNNWTRIAMTGPPARRSHAMTFDQARQAAVMFGGRTSQAIFDDGVWELRGPCGAKAWIQLVVPGPRARAASALVYDVRRRVSVLFGGETGAGPSSDTWEWNGSEWTERAPTVAPPPRIDHAMAYDPRGRRPVLFGGNLGNLELDDTWHWDGDAGTWRRIDTIVTPVPLTRMKLAPDLTGGLVIVGGVDTFNIARSEVLRLRYEHTASLERCQVAALDLDGDGLAGCDDPDCRSRCAPLCPVDTALSSCTGPRCGDQAVSPVEDYLICPSDVVAP
jgi:hypothetical protein